MAVRVNHNYTDFLYQKCMDEDDRFIVIVGDDGEVHFANATAEKADLGGAGYLPLLVGMKVDIQEVFATGVGQELNTAGAGMGVEMGWYRSRLEPVIVEGGVDAVMVVAKDITAEKYAQDLSICRSEVLDLISEGAPLVPVLTALTCSIESVMPGMKCSILLVSKNKKTLCFGAAPSLPDFYNEAVDGIPIGPGIGCCGTAAHEGCRVVVANTMVDEKWEAFKDLAARAGLVACWSEPVLGSDGEVLGTFALYYGEAREPFEREIEFIESAAQLTGIAIERHKSAEQNRLFVNELNHRVKNILASVRSLTKQTIRASVDLDEFEDVFMGRLTTMTKTHEALALSKWEGLSLADALGRVMGQFNCGPRTQIKMAGPEVHLPPEKVMPLCLSLHELGTNSLKYGALCAAEGCVELSWMFDEAEGRVCLDWVESGGPMVVKPTRYGVGTKLIDGLIGFELNGEVRFDYEEAGLNCRMSFGVKSKK